jgi:Spy/CpxP family protein refolding chaperone
MKTCIGKVAASFIAAVMALTGPAVFAQDERETRPPQGEEIRRGERFQPPFAPGAPARMMPGFERAYQVLTDEQRASLRDAFGSQREKMRDLEEQMRAARRELLEASLAEKPDEKRIRKRAMAVGRIEADIAVLRAKALAGIQPPLSSEQREKIKSASTEFAPPPGGLRPEFRRDRSEPAREEFRRRERVPERGEDDVPRAPRP